MKFTKCTIDHFRLQFSGIWCIHNVAQPLPLSTSKTFSSPKRNLIPPRTHPHFPSHPLAPGSHTSGFCLCGCVCSGHFHIVTLIQYFLCLASFTWNNALKVPPQGPWTRAPLRHVAHTASCGFTSLCISMNSWTPGWMPLLAMVSGVHNL